MEHSVRSSVFLPREFTLPRQETSIYIPLQWEPYEGDYNYQAVARLSLGATIEQASADLARMTAIWGGLLARLARGDTMGYLRTSAEAELRGE